MKKYVKKQLWILFLVCILSAVPVYADNQYVVDQADLLTDEEETAINHEIIRIRDTYQCDVVVVTTNDSEGKSATAYADDFFDYNGYGIGEERDGILLSINMDIRNYALSTSGQAITIFSDSELERMSDNFVPYLSAGQYAKGIEDWLSDVDFELRTDDGTGYAYEERNPWVTALVELPTLFLFGLICSAITIVIMVMMSRTAVKPQMANEYIDKNSFKVRVQEDRFLRSNTTKVKIESSSSGGGSRSSGGGSRTHRSSSGRSHGGRSGRF
ncbi:MAG: TPM domain-containing protein [Clostridia bacterium]|nr:TPM domain-containing protein [Clostridia bacterium]